MEKIKKIRKKYKIFGNNQTIIKSIGKIDQMQKVK